MANYDWGYSGRRDHRGGDWSNPNGPGMRSGYGRGGGERPWVGGYRDGYQGGSGGMRTGGTRGGGNYDAGMRGPGMGAGGAQAGRGGRDEWWLGGHHPGRYDETYDRAYQEFDQQNRPRYSPVGGTYSAMGGSYRYRGAPRPLRDDMWFSDWTRWF